MSCVNLPTVLPGSPSKTRGQIQVILGPMFSGKSTELMRRVRRFQIAQYKCLVIKYAKDTRYSNSFSTHDRNTMDALPACLLRDTAQEALGAAVIGIDEGQFGEDDQGSSVDVSCLVETLTVLLWELEDGLVPALQQGNTPYVHGVLYLYQDLASTQKALELLGKRYGRLQPYVEEEYLQDKK
ncbi:Hypothetical predicted protein [Marmota monax]|uniref:Thymidine kinase n=1 Tax=Marmota monax TaxID=9995 RepID=A0A5E4ARL5_MARMO|nr:Hypothetical predicted protein [Marmota monax]